MGARSPSTVGNLAWVAAFCVMVGLGSMLMNGLGSAFDNAAMVVVALLGAAGFLGLLGVQMNVAKKVLEAHYDLQRTAQLLQEAVERLAASANRGGPSFG